MATFDGDTLRGVMARYAEALRLHREEIDSLNVFPVPDGDTGTNMLLTQEAVHEAVRDLGGTSLPEVGEAISRAALMAARGNSGVILSQVLRGLCARVAGSDEPGPGDLADGLVEAAEEARRAVAKPAEGTMLSVIRDAAEAARAASDGDGTFEAVAEAALAEALESLERTRGLLPALSEAGVVDAGGKGLVLLLDALVATLRGVPLSVEVGPTGPVGRSDGAGGNGARDLEFEFEVQYLLEGADDAIPGLRGRLGGLGDSLVIVGGTGLYNVHVHTNEPDAAVDAGNEVGATKNVSVVSLADQVAEHCLAGQARAVRVGDEPDLAPVGIVAVVPGDGVAKLFRSLGASVVRGGPGENPSVADLVAAIDGAPAESVLLLPNHKNVLPAAERAAAEAGKPARVIPTRSVPEGIAAATAFGPDSDLEDNARMATEAASQVVSAEVASAIRDADTPAGAVTKGECLGVIAGEVRFVGPDATEIARRLVEALRSDEHEILTVLAGIDVSDEQAEVCRVGLEEAFPSLEIEVHRGDQPHYPFLIGLE